MKRFISVMLVFFMAAHAQSQARISDWSWSDSADLLTSSSYLSTLASASYQVVTENIYKTITHPATGWIVGGLCSLTLGYRLSCFTQKSEDSDWEKLNAKIKQLSSDCGKKNIVEQPVSDWPIQFEYAQQDVSKFRKIDFLTCHRHKATAFGWTMRARKLKNCESEIKLD